MGACVMQPREVISATSTRWSRVVPSRGGFTVYYGIPGVCAANVFLLDEQRAHTAAKRWELEGVEPRGPETLVGLGPVDEQLEAVR